uniref:Rhodanese domain-containing protein n=1 Tax=Phaeomonas parva TaxID=124430 RepID=A0A7S1U895_9STRA
MRRARRLRRRRRTPGCGADAKTPPRARGVRRRWVPCARLRPTPSEAPSGSALLDDVVAALEALPSHHQLALTVVLGLFFLFLGWRNARVRHRQGRTKSGLGTMLAAMELTYVDGDELRGWIKENGRVSGVDAAWGVVDVRDEDFDEMGGHIPGCIHIGSEDFDEDAADRLVERIKGTGGALRRLIFHCTMSQVRGPTLASSFKARLTQEEDEDFEPPEVCVLAGGFRRWSRAADGDPDFITIG